MKRVNQTSFYSELLNVYAYLRTQAGNVADQLEKTGDEIISTSRTVAANRKELDQMMCQAHKLSELTGIPFEPSVVKKNRCLRLHSACRCRVSKTLRRNSSI